ncbi:MAG TPA: Hvo_1808 family surface protein [Natrialbaceae archaeon]|nr:Hvo_1808 family surface protein [Natrialbaceae archaeon]
MGSRSLAPVVLALVGLVVLAGCSTVLDDPGASPNATGDGLGVENGYAYDESLSVDASDGLDEAELHAVVSRMMARIEHVRGLEFEQSVPVTVITRDEYRERVGNRGPEDVRPWEEQFWEATFVVGEETTVGEARGGVFGSTVQGYYNGTHIVIVSEDPDSTLPSRATIVHELQHALQDQHGLLGGRATDTHDGDLAASGIVEGDANYVEHEYEQRCEGEWSCIPKPDSSGGGGGSSFNLGLFVSVFVPYSDGPTLVADLRDRDGWTAVNEALRSPPTSTEQVIHPAAYPNETPASVRIEDRSSDSWHRFETEKGYRWDTVGEATLFAAFWSNGVIERGHLQGDSTSLSPYDYDHPITAGWGGDRIVPYANGTAEGYVFASTWDTERDAREFHEGYLELLRSHDAEEVAPGVYRVPEPSPYADAFRVVRNGTRVTVVNAPSVAALDDVHAATGEGVTNVEETTDSPSIPVAGFGVLVALVALVVAVGLLIRHTDRPR